MPSWLRRFAIANKKVNALLQVKLVTHAQTTKIVWYARVNGKDDAYNIHLLFKIDSKAGLEKYPWKFQRVESVQYNKQHIQKFVLTWFYQMWVINKVSTWILLVVVDVIMLL